MLGQKILLFFRKHKQFLTDDNIGTVKLDMKVGFNIK